jgi:hypothetical protein
MTQMAKPDLEVSLVGGYTVWHCTVLLDLISGTGFATGQKPVNMSTTNYTVQAPYSEVDPCSPGQNIPCILWHMTIIYHIHKAPALDPNLRPHF